MPLPSQPTRSKATTIEYRRRTHELSRRCRKELGIHNHEILDFRRFVGWLITQKTTWARTTWRQYKASVVYFLEQEIVEHNDPLAQEALEALLPVDVEGCVAVTKKTSGSKLKKFPMRDFYTLEQHLSNQPGEWHQPLRRWLIAGVLTGLRPQEWAQARYTEINGEDALVVVNAKATNGRAHGPNRTLLLGGLSLDERGIVREHVAAARNWAEHEQFRHFYQACASTLGRLSRRLWPKRPQHVSLYSARHQFSADAKASGMSREEIAALMGHAVDDTATKHYGKKTAGHRLVRVRPDPLDVERVRRVYLDRYTGPGREPQPSPKATVRPVAPSPLTPPRPSE